MQRQCHARRIGAAIATGLTLAAVLAAALAGCHGRKATSVAATAPPRWAGVTLTVACPDGPAKLVMQRHGAGWARSTGATLKLVPLAESAAGADVLVLPAPDLPHWADAGTLAVVPTGEGPVGMGRAGDWDTLLHTYKSRLL